MKKTSIKMIFLKILYIMIIPIIIYNLIIIIQSMINPTLVPNVFGIKTFDIVSNSMAPAINVNDLAIVKMCTIDDLNENDIVTFNTEHGYVTHRISKINKENGQIFFTTKGDNNIVVDMNEVDFNQIEGKYIGKIPMIGKLLSALRNQDTFFLILTILIIGYLTEKKKIYKKLYRREKREAYNRRRLLVNT